MLIGFLKNIYIYIHISAITVYPPFCSLWLRGIFWLKAKDVSLSLSLVFDFVHTFTNEFIQFMVKDSTFMRDIFFTLWTNVGWSQFTIWVFTLRTKTTTTFREYKWHYCSFFEMCTIFIQDKDKELRLILSSFCDSYFSLYNVH